MQFIGCMLSPTTFELNLSIILFLFSFIDATEKRYNPEMSPDIPEDKWRKGSQVIFCFVVLLTWIRFIYLLKVWAEIINQDIF